MIIGYWQSHGALGLIGGNGNNDWSSSNQSYIKSMIASSDHFYDYVGYTSGSTFISYGPGKDRLDVYPGGPPYHADNSLADFMWSSRLDAADGWSGEDMQSNVLLKGTPLETPIGMVAYARNLGYTNATGHYEYFGSLWVDFKKSIDAGHPVELFVTSTTSGVADHFVTAFGYNDATNQYECYEGDGTAPEWYDFQELAANKPFSIQSGAFFVAPEPATLSLLAFGGFAALMARARRRQR